MPELPPEDKGADIIEFPGPRQKKPKNTQPTADVRQTRVPTVTEAYAKGFTPQQVFAAVMLGHIRPDDHEPPSTVSEADARDKGLTPVETRVLLMRGKIEPDKDGALDTKGPDMKHPYRIEDPAQTGVAVASLQTLETRAVAHALNHPNNPSDHRKRGRRRDK